jgi:hypothetical protein
VVFFTAPREQPTTAHLVPVAQPDGAGLALTGTF